MPNDLTPPPAETKRTSLAEMTAEEFAAFAGPPPAWLEAAWAHAKANGLDKLTDEEVDAEIEAYRAEKRAARLAQTT